MNFNRKFAKASVFALALGAISLFSGYEAKAASATPKFDNNTGVFTTGADSTKFWAVAKPVKDAKKANVKDSGKNYTIKASDVEDYSKGVDLTFADGKETYIAYGDANAVGDDGVYTGWKVAKISAANSKFKVYYLSEQHGKMGKGKASHDLGGVAGYLAAEIGEGKKVTEINLATESVHQKIEAKAGDGAWKKLSDFIGGGVDAGKVNTKLLSLIQRGANLSFRYAADAIGWAKETKLKVPAQPKAPKVGIDVKKDEITGLKKGMEYQLVEKSSSGETTPTNSWQEVGDKVKSIKFSDVKPTAVNYTKDYVLFVRNKADSKKVTSKVTKVILSKSEAVNVGAEISNRPEGNLVVETQTPKVTISLSRKHDVTKGAVITNLTTDDYEVYVNGAAHTATTLPEKAKWTLLKGKKTEDAKPVMLKLKYATGNKANSYHNGKFTVLVRKAGKKLENNEATMASETKKVDVTFAKIAQTGSIVANTSTGTSENASDTAVKANFKSGEGAEVTFQYQITNYQNSDKKPRLSFTKVPNVTVKVGNFEVTEGNTNAVATITVTLDKRATQTTAQQIKINAEGAAEISPTVTFTVSQ